MQGTVNVIYHPKNLVDITHIYYVLTKVVKPGLDTRN